MAVLDSQVHSSAWEQERGLSVYRMGRRGRRGEGEGEEGGGEGVGSSCPD